MSICPCDQLSCYKTTSRDDIQQLRQMYKSIIQQHLLVDNMYFKTSIYNNNGIAVQLTMYYILYMYTLY